MKFARIYSAPGDPYAGVTFEPRSSKIVNPDGLVIFEAKDVMVPSTWSQVAVDVLAQKYCRKAGVPTATAQLKEEGVPDLAPTLDRRRAPTSRRLRATISSAPNATRVRSLTRMAGCWTYWGWKAPLFRFRKRRADLLRRDVRDARATDRCAELSAMVQHRPALGVRHLGPRTRALVRRGGRRDGTTVARYVFLSASQRLLYFWELKTISLTRAVSSTALCEKRGSLRAGTARRS